ncbi:hypothetical protein OG976_10235 [Mycobacterium sp. NBC_00419]|uniref:hypothetical protein n=1 Tax=Mycobacterium sp. NBC_00419 TaxID=2975989 RepID=UPI002E1DBB2F
MRPGVVRWTVGLLTGALATAGLVAATPAQAECVNSGGGWNNGPNRPTPRSN